MAKLDKVDITKKITKFVVGQSVMFTAAGVIASNAPFKKTYQKVEIFIASYVIGMIVSEVAEDFTDRKIDETIEWWNQFTTKSPA